MSGWTAGALVFYSGGTYGHVAICAEDSGVIFSTDLPNKGKVLFAFFFKRYTAVLFCLPFHFDKHLRSAAWT